MITQEDYNFITQFELTGPSPTGQSGQSGSGQPQGQSRGQFLEANRMQCAKTFLSLLSHISKDQTIQYILCLIDEMLNEDKSRVEIFKEFSKTKKESPWTTFLGLLNRSDGFIQNMVC